MTFDVAIVGAGIAGLAAAQTLESMGKTTITIDKGRGVGGRMSTRRLERGRCDHGAQFITVRDAEFRQQLESWVRSGVATEWCRGFGTGSADAGTGDGHPRYCGTDGMNRIPKAMATSLTVEVGERITTLRLADTGDGIELRSESGILWSARALILTPPVPQSLDLIDASPDLDLPADDRARLETVAYEPCIALMMRLDRASQLPQPGGLRPTGGSIAWIADNQRKGISEESTLTVHLDGATSERMFDEPSLVPEKLSAELGPYVGDAEVLETQVHRWRYSAPRAPFGRTTLATSLRDSGGASPSESHVAVAFAGDAFTPPDLPSRVEGAWISGRAAAGAISSL